MLKTLLITVLLGVTQTACNEFTGASSEIEHKKSDSPTKDSDLVGSEAITVSEPISVGGAFLVCAYDVDIDASGDNMGCRVEDDQGNRKDITPSIEDLDIRKADSQMAEEISISQDEFWHWHVVIDLSEIDLYAVTYTGSEPLEANTTAVQEVHPEKMEQDTTLLENFYQDRHIIFATGERYVPGEGLFTSTRAADVLCMQSAARSQILGRFVAVLSDSQSNARDRIMINMPVYNINGEIVSNRNQFWTANHQASIAFNQNMDDEYEDDTAEARAWSGGDISGRFRANESCNDWTGSEDGNGKTGRILDPGRWMEGGRGGNVACDEAHHLYCISQ